MRTLHPQEGAATMRERWRANQVRERWLVHQYGGRDILQQDCVRNRTTLRGKELQTLRFARTSHVIQQFDSFTRRT